MLSGDGCNTFVGKLTKATSSVQGPSSSERAHGASTLSPSIISLSSSTLSRTSQGSATPDIAQRTATSLATIISPIERSTGTGGSISTVAAVAIACGVAVIGAIAVWLVWFWQKRKQQRRIAAETNSLRAFELRGYAGSDADAPASRDECGPASSTCPRTWSSSDCETPWNQMIPRPLEPSARRPLPLRGALHSQRSNTPTHLHRLEAVQDEARKKDAARRAHFAALSRVDDHERTTKTAADVDRKIESSDRSSDVPQRLRAVDPAFAEWWETKYYQKIAEGYPHQQAMSLAIDHRVPDEHHEEQGASPWQNDDAMGWRASPPPSPSRYQDVAATFRPGPGRKPAISSVQHPTRALTAYRCGIPEEGPRRARSSLSPSSTPTPPPPYRASQRRTASPANKIGDKMRERTTKSTRSRARPEESSRTGVETTTTGTTTTTTKTKTNSSEIELDDIPLHDDTTTLPATVYTPPPSSRGAAQRRRFE